MSGKEGVIVIGYGRIGQVHLASVLAHPKLFLHTLVGKDETRCKTALAAALKPHLNREGKLKEGAMPHALSSDKFKELIEKNDPAFENARYVIIASPTPNHAELIELALKYKKPFHILCEKPLTTDPETNKQLYEKAQKAGSVLITAYNRRFDPHFMKLKETVQNKAGKVQILRLTSRDHPAPPSEFLDSAGTFFEDFSTHDIDMARWLVGEEPEKVWACASQLLPVFKSKGIDDTAVIVLKFPSGCLCLIENSRRTTYGYDQRAEVLGTSGLVIANNPKRSAVTWHSAAGEVDDLAQYSFPERYKEGYFNELDHLVKVAHNAEKARVNADDVANNAKLCMTCQDSRVKQVVVQDQKLTEYPIPENFPVKTTGTVNFALFGVGRMGCVRADAILANPNARLLAVYDVDQERAAMIAKQYNCKHAVAPADAMLPEVDAVVICTTTAAHCEVILMAAKAKKNVFVEKPVALSTADTELCVKTCKENGVFLYCGFHRRSDAEFRQAYEGLSKLGSVELIRISSRDAADHNSLAYLLNSGNYWYDSLIHDFDVARWIAGSEPIEVFSVGSASIPELAERGDIDNVVVVLRFPNGAICTIDNNRRAVYGYDQRLEVFGANGMVEVHNKIQSELTYGSFDGFACDKTQAGLTRYKETYINETNHFINLLLGVEKTPRVFHYDSVRNAKIADAAFESFKTGKSVAIHY